MQAFMDNFDRQSKKKEFINVGCALSTSTSIDGLLDIPITVK